MTGAQQRGIRLLALLCVSIAAVLQLTVPTVAAVRATSERVATAGAYSYDSSRQLPVARVSHVVRSEVAGGEADARRRPPSTAQLLTVVSGVAAEAGGAGSNIVYRGLAEGEDVAAGLMARAPGASVSPMSHVAGKGASPWISTSKSLDVASNKYGKFGVVGIDLSKVSGEVVDVSGGFPGVPGMLSNWARLDQEVLIRDFVPPGAIFFP